MKKCPFCAEEIQDAAIKCRFCNSFLSDVPAAANAAVLTPAVTQGAAALLMPGIATSAKTPSVPARKTLYVGSPSWRAFFRTYALLSLGFFVLPVLSYSGAELLEVRGLGLFLAVAIPPLLMAVGLLMVHYYRNSMVFRVTSSNIESEFGFFSKRIDVLELWRCRDVQYRQSFFDRVIGIAHIDIYTTDVTTPNVCIVGLPASRELFENIRDAIEIQRQSRNVVGMIQ